VPKSGDTAERTVSEATTDVLLKLGLYGIKVKIALKEALPPDFQIRADIQPEKKENGTTQAEGTEAAGS